MDDKYGEDGQNYAKVDSPKANITEATGLHYDTKTCGVHLGLTYQMAR